MTLPHYLEDSTIIELESKINSIEEQISSAVIKSILAFWFIFISCVSIIGAILRDVNYRWYLFTFSILFLIFGLIIYLKCKRKLAILKEEKNKVGTLYKSELLDQKMNNSNDEELYFYRN